VSSRPLDATQRDIPSRRLGSPGTMVQRRNEYEAPDQATRCDRMISSSPAASSAVRVQGSSRSCLTALPGFERLHPPLDVVGLHHRFSEESAASTSSPAAGSLAPRWILAGSSLDHEPSKRFWDGLSSTGARCPPIEVAAAVPPPGAVWHERRPRCRLTPTGVLTASRRRGRSCSTCGGSFAGQFAGQFAGPSEKATS